MVEVPPSHDDGDAREQPSVSEPSKLIRIASMTRAMLDEVREAPLDAAGRVRLVSIYEGSLDELKEVLSEDLVEELDAVFVPITDDPTEAELQASLISQQMAAAAQLDRMRQRKALEQSTPSEGNGLYL